MPHYNTGVLDTSRPIIPNSVSDAEIQTVLNHLNTTFERTREAIRCPRHDVNPKVDFSANREEGIYYEALVCCPDLDDMVSVLVDRHLIEHPFGEWRFGGC